MRSVHYFPRYSQPENVVTNNALLLLVRLREFSRLKFENLIEQLCADQEVEFQPQWLSFGQQVGSGTSVVDGYIAQESVKIVVETKLHGSFNADQLRRHLDIFGHEEHRLLILLSPSLDTHSTTQLAVSRETANSRGIHLIHASFEQVVSMVRSGLAEHEETMHALVDDFEAFCSDMKLLPKDEYSLFVPPCRQSLEDNLEFKLYYCPAERNLRKAKFLGVYANRVVRAVGRISKRFACSIDLETETITIIGPQVTLTTEETQRIIGAAQNAPSHNWDITTGHQFLLCDEWAKTDFRKRTAGGIWNLRYFDLRDLFNTSIPQDINRLADILSQHTWE